MQSTRLVVLSLLLGSVSALRLSSDASESMFSNLRRYLPNLKEESSEDWGRAAKKSKPSRHKPTEENADGSKPIFYAVIMGKLAYRHQVSLWLSSLRKLGGFQHEAMIVTDKPACLAKTLEEAKLLGAQISTDENVDIYEPGSGYQGNIHIVKRPTVKSINKMKLEKARAWINVKVAKIPHPISSIIYTDEDIVIAKNLKEFISIVHDLEKQKFTLALFRDTGLSAGELHTGIVVMFPGKFTDDCLQAWGKKLTGVSIGSAEFKADLRESEESAELADIEEDAVLEEEAKAMGPDQQALHGTGQCRKKTYGHDGIKILPKPYFWLPTPGGMKKDHKAEFVHFTNTGRWKRIGNKDIKSYLTRIGIPEHIDPLGHVEDKACADDQ